MAPLCLLTASGATLTAVHDFAKNFSPDRFRTYGVGEKLEETDNKHKPVQHPVVRTNP